MSEYDPHALCFAPCFGCKTMFGFNPHKVPSLRVNTEGKVDPTVERKPFCANCMARANQWRAGHGLEPHFIHPEAYSPIPEGDL